MSTPDPTQQGSTIQQLLNSNNVPLKYTIASASSWSGTYHPSNILHDRPHEMYSRWSGPSQHAVSAATSPHYLNYVHPAQQAPASPNSSSITAVATAAAAAAAAATASASPSSASSASKRAAAAGQSQPGAATQQPQKQYIVLKLEKPSVVRSITFGKYHKPHPCNLRDFKVYGASNLEDLLPASSTHGRPSANKRLLRGGLKNDANPETFEMRWLEDAASSSGSGSSVDGSSLLPGEGELDRRAATAALINTENAVPFAVRYLKIIPLAAYTPNYNFSIWHIALSGISNPALVSRVIRSYEEHRQSTTTRLILKHLRQHGHATAFQALLQSSRLGPTPDASAQKLVPFSPQRPFEHPLLTTIFDALCRRGAWDEVEICLTRAAYGDILGVPAPAASSPMSPGGSLANTSLSASGHWTQPWQKCMFSSYISRQIPKASWSQLLPPTQPVQQRDSLTTSSLPSFPSGRGGHAMVFDTEKGIAYLFGGWDGKQDLSDLWAYHVHENRWRLISTDTRLQGGPGPRSCHKMCLDEKSGCIYLLGRYIDYESLAHGTPADSVPSNTRSTPTMPSQSTMVTPSSSTVRTTRNNFLARYLDSVPQEPNAEANLDAEVLGSEGAGIGARSPPTSGSTPARPARHPEISSSSHSGTAAETSPLLEGDANARSPRPASRPSTTSSPRPASQLAHPSTASAPGREADFFRFSTRSEKWERLSADTYSDGGPKLIYDHGLVVDSQNQMIYVFGGRVTDPDPNKYEFSGMWRYDIIQRTWTFLFDDRTSNGAKILSRSGHSMLLDSGKPGSTGMSPSHTRQIWIQGGQRGASAGFLSDMYTYNLATGAVREISRNTAQNGPEATFTQRATIDVSAREISVFVGLIGGRGDRKTSAFWIYSIPRASWRKVYQYEGGQLSEFETDSASGASRFGTHMDDSSLSSSGHDVDGELEGDDIPESGPLQALPSYSDDAGGDEEMPMEPPLNSWVQYAGQTTYDPPADPSTLLGSRGGTPILSPNPANKDRAGSGSEPSPRYAAQMVFDERRKVYYLHGGNPEDPHMRSRRLDDFWKLTLLRPTPGEILRRAKFRVRRQRFLEMTRGTESTETEQATAKMGPLAEAPRVGLDALMYLQSEVGTVVDHSDETESRMFRRLMSHLLNVEAPTTSSNPIARVAETGSSTLSSPVYPTSVDAAAGPKRAREEVYSDEVDMADSVSSLDADSDMMSASQTLPARGAKKANVPAVPHPHVREEEGRPSALYMERSRLFRELLDYFNPELAEPRADMGACVEVAFGG